MKKITILLLCSLLNACCSKEETCICSKPILNFVFQCFNEDELANFRIMKYDTTNGRLISNEPIPYFITNQKNAQMNIDIQELKYTIVIQNSPLGINRSFSKGKYILVDKPTRCYDCKTKIHYKACKEVSGISFLVNNRPIAEFDQRGERYDFFVSARPCVNK